MLTISNKSDYGLLLLTLLAKKSQADFVPLSQITKESGLPRAFVSRIAALLANGKLLKSKEGINGGYKLAKFPDKISIAAVTAILDGPWQPTKCTSGKKTCPLLDKCPMADNWQNRLKEKMWKMMDSYTIKDLLR